VSAVFSLKIKLIGDTIYALDMAKNDHVGTRFGKNEISAPSPQPPIPQLSSPLEKVPHLPLDLK